MSARIKSVTLEIPVGVERINLQQSLVDLGVVEWEQPLIVELSAMQEQNNCDLELDGTTLVIKSEHDHLILIDVEIGQVE